MDLLESYGKEILEKHSELNSVIKTARWFLAKYPDILATEEKISGIIKRLVKYNKRDKSTDLTSEMHEALINECIEVGIPISDAKHYWYKGQHFSIFAKNPQKTTESLLDAVSSIISKYNPDKLRTIEKTKITKEQALKVVLSDIHIGLEPNPLNESLFAYQYNEQIFKDNLDKVYNSVVKEFEIHGKFDLLIIDDLGDGLDGWDAQTTRKGHSLDQNMTNLEAFRTFVEGKLTLIENCIRLGVANEIHIRSVANDNHAGEFAKIANHTIKMILNRSYDPATVKVHTLNRFIEHFVYGNHTFILTHGKDRQFMFKGLPYKLDDKAIKFITDYIDHNEITTPYIVVEKGDLHRAGYERTNRFGYRNYASFAPPSAWVQHNFGDCYAGYAVQVIPKWTNDIAHTDYVFNLKKNLRKPALQFGT